MTNFSNWPIRKISELQDGDCLGYFEPYPLPGLGGISLRNLLPIIYVQRDETRLHLTYAIPSGRVISTTFTIKDPERDAGPVLLTGVKDYRTIVGCQTDHISIISPLKDLRISSDGLFSLQKPALTIKQLHLLDPAVRVLPNAFKQLPFVQINT